jgi:hypothetical protein
MTAASLAWLLCPGIRSHEAPSRAAEPDAQPKAGFTNHLTDGKKVRTIYLNRSDPRNVDERDGERFFIALAFYSRLFAASVA